MGFDRNTIIGFVLLGILFMGYFWYVSSNQKEAMLLKQQQEDSIAALKPKVDSVKWRADSVAIAQQRDSISAGNFAVASNGAEEELTVSNSLMTVTFSNKGGWVKKVTLNNYKDPDSSQVMLGGSDSDKFGYAINTAPGQSIETWRLFFTPMEVTKAADGSQVVSYTLAGPAGQAITHRFEVSPNDYMIKAAIQVKGAAQLFSNPAFNLIWHIEAQAHQEDKFYERTQTRIVFKTDNEFDYYTAGRGVEEAFATPTEWVGLKQQFFNTTMLSGNKFSNVKAEVLTPEEEDTTKQIATMRIGATQNIGDGNVPLQLYYGPNDYNVLKAYDNDMNNIVDYGSGMFAFVKWINRWLILPVFTFLTKIMGGHIGWAILLLTFFIRLIIAPLTYSSYLSGAKMKALRPELDAMRARVGKDQQAQSMEQMKLFREAGVNPLGGCIPALFQIPIFFALYSFFNSHLALRGEPFLWAKDLSMYDSVLDFGFNIPFYGDHISLFTITACITSMFISLYSMSATPDTGNPVMKYMPYIFPVMMLFIFNKLPSALTWYYTVSNVITLALQWVIQTYIIDHDKILAQLQANKAKPKKKSKWQERFEAMQETQKKVEDLKKKTQNRK